MSFQDKVVWITGASSGIGEHLAYEFALQNATLVLSGRKEEALNKVKANCNLGSDILVLPMDVTDFDVMEGAVAKVMNAYGKVDVLINNAGISQRSLAMQTDFSVDRKIMEVNFFGALALTKAVLPSMIENQSGQIVIISSVVGKAGVPGRSAYSASKHALHGYFDALRAELYNDNIKVTIICPGYVQTQISKNALTGDGTFHGSTDKTTANGLTAQNFAKKALRAIARQKKEVYLGKRELVAIYLNRFAPTLYADIVRRFRVRNL